ncbi:MAG: hypothetical protein ACXV5Q_14235 [Frankiaceae bacterium]
MTDSIAADRGPGVNRRGNAEVKAGLLWAVLVAAGAALAALAVQQGWRVGVGAAPFTGRYELKIDLGSVPALIIAAGVLVGVRRGLLESLPWRWLLLAGYTAALAWTLALSVVDGGNGLSHGGTHDYWPDVPAVDDHPGGFLRDFVAHAGSYTTPTATHPPGPVLLLWLFDKAGVTSPAAIGLILAALGCLTVPLVAVAVRSLCSDLSARRIVPVLALAPYAIWVGVSMDGLVATLAAASLAVGVMGSEPSRRPIWAAVAGLLLGVAALFDYSVAWLGLSVLAVYFVRRRPLLNVVSAAGSLAPLLLMQIWGFVWPAGLSSARHRFFHGIGADRAWLLWIFLDVLLLLLACGPTVVLAFQRFRMTPGWPFLVGSVSAVAFGLAFGLSRGEVERTWLPYFPWLLVPAVAPEIRGQPAGPVPLTLVAIGALTGIVVEALLRSPW